jgi:hypothetical protein
LTGFIGSDKLAAMDHPIRNLLGWLLCVAAIGVVGFNLGRTWEKSQIGDGSNGRILVVITHNPELNCVSRYTSNSRGLFIQIKDEDEFFLHKRSVDALAGLNN